MLLLSGTKIKIRDNKSYWIGFLVGYFCCILGGWLSPKILKLLRRKKKINYPLVTAEDKRILKRQSDHTLAFWSNHLNCWEWPVELPNPEPRPIKGADYIPNSRRSQLMAWISDRIGEKYINMIWNTEYQTGPHKMTVPEWEAWWAEDHEK